jgi:hypothetical protein
MDALGEEREKAHVKVAIDVHKTPSACHLSPSRETRRAETHHHDDRVLPISTDEACISNSLGYDHTHQDGVEEAPIPVS